MVGRRADLEHRRAPGPQGERDVLAGLGGAERAQGEGHRVAQGGQTGRIGVVGEGEADDVEADGGQEGEGGVLRQGRGDFVHAEALNDLALLYRRQGEVQLALVHYLQALPRLRRAGAPSELAVAASNIGALYGVFGDRAREDNNFPGARQYVIENKKSGSYKDKEKEKEKKHDESYEKAFHTGRGHKRTKGWGKRESDCS